MDRAIEIVEMPNGMFQVTERRPDGLRMGWNVDYSLEEAQDKAYKEQAFLMTMGRYIPIERVKYENMQGATHHATIPPEPVIITETIGLYKFISWGATFDKKRYQWTCFAQWIWDGVTYRCQASDKNRRDALLKVEIAVGNIRATLCMGKDLSGVDDA